MKIFIPNEYNSTVSNSAAYISNEFSPFSRFKATIGLRAENYVQRHTGRDQRAAARISNAIDQGISVDIVKEQILEDGDGNFLDDEKVLDALDLFPSANLIYELKENMNLRASYSRTIARPSFKELSFAQIIDPVSNRIFNGGLFEYDDWDGNLSETRIDNIDLRWEMFLPKGQLFSASIFYKSFDDPIELVRIPTAQNASEFQPRNVGDGQVYGAEVEFRKHLGFISPALDKISLSTNVTVVESVIDMTDTEFTSRKNFEKDGENVEDTREMAGQAPYIINAGLSYSDIDRALDMGFYYNVKGETLTVVGGGIFPDVYSEPFHSLKFSLNKAFGPDQRTSLSFNVSNILNDLREEFYTSFRAEDQVFTRFNPGISFSLGLKYSVL
jgi:outer membrane receptor protein involved in Fe transport